MDISDNAIILTSEPIPDMTPSEWLQFHNNCESDSNLANALAGAWNQSGWLMHEISEDCCTADMEQRFHEWWKLQAYLVQKIKILEQVENPNIILDDLPYEKIVAPFMEHNRYRFCCGWWLQKT